MSWFKRETDKGSVQGWKGEPSHITINKETREFHVSTEVGDRKTDSAGMKTRDKFDSQGNWMGTETY